MYETRAPSFMALLASYQAEIPVEAHSEACDWHRREGWWLSWLCRFIGSGFPPPGQHQRDPHLLRELAGKGNELSTRPSQGTGQETLDGTMAWVQEDSEEGQRAESPSQVPARGQPPCPSQSLPHPPSRDLSLFHQRELLLPDLNLTPWEGKSGSRKQEAGAEVLGLWGQVPHGYLTVAD